MECEVSVEGFDWSMCQNLNNWNVLWMNPVQMRQRVVGRCQVGGGLQVLLYLVNASDFASVQGSCIIHCSFLLLCMVVRQ